MFSEFYSILLSDALFLNLFYMLLGGGARVGANALIFILLARVFGSESYGVFMYGFVFAFIFQVVIDFGFTVQLVKDLVESPNKKVEIFTKAITFKHTIVLVTTVFSLLILFAVQESEMTVKITMLLILYSILSSYCIFFTLPFHSVKKFKVSALVAILSNTLLIVFVIIAVRFFPSNLIVVATAFGLSQIPSLFIGLILFKAEFSSLPLAKLNFSGAKNTFLDCLPYGLSNFFAVAYFQVDTFFIEYYHGASELGVYQAGSKLALISMFLVNTYNNIYLPYCIAMRENRGKFIKTNRIVVSMSTLVGFTTLVCFTFFPEFLVNFVYGESYINLIPLLPFFGMVMVLRCTAASYGLFITVYDMQVQRCWSLFFTLLLVVALNYVLVPAYSSKGALVSLVFAQFLLLLMYFSLTYSKVHATLLSFQTLLLYLGGGAVFLYFLGCMDPFNV